ncbi:hypothetical protein T265_15076, partial [Opisthorchis viverrini]
KNLPGCKDIEQSEVEKEALLFLRARKRDVSRAVELYKANKEIQEFISQVKNLPGCKDIEQSEVEKEALLFLRARKRDVSRAVELYKANKRMRYTENVTSIDPLEEGVRKELLSGKFTVLPGTGTDDLSATIAIFTAHRHWPPLTTHRDTLKGVLYQLDVAMMDEQSQRKGLIVLYDMRDTKYSNFDYYLCIKLLNLFKGSYPARLRKVIIIEAPFWFRAPFGVLRLFVKEKMRDRIFTVDLDELHVHLSPSLIESWFQQLTEHRHFDWLRECLTKTGHVSQIPNDYFTIPPPIYRSLSSSGSDLLQSDGFSRSSLGNSRYSSLRYSRPIYSLRQTSEPQSVFVDPYGSLSHNNPDPVVANGPLSRREHGSLNRMLTSMYSSTVQSPTRSYHSSLNNDVILSPFELRQRSLRVPKSRIRNNNCLHTTNSLTLSSSPPPCNLFDESNKTDPQSQTRLSVPEFIERVQTAGQLGLCAEFDAMFKDRPIDGSCDRFLLTENRRRNRYLDVPCLDATAVELSDGTYLHANWVNGYRIPRAYILAQGPLDTTRREFWMAVWEHRVPVIVMLTKVVENHRVKCAPYWPTRTSVVSTSSSSNHTYSSHRHSLLNHTSACSPDASQDRLPPTSCYGDVQLVNLSKSMEPNGLSHHTRLELRRKPSSQTNDRRGAKQSDSVPKVGASSTNESDKPFEVDHFLYLGWPDFDVPTDSTGFLNFMDQVKKLHEKRCQQELGPTESSLQPGSKTHHPLLVHCSAGIGRTGTFVTVDICLQQALNEGYIDVPQVVSRLRCQRAGAVQVAKQYAFIHSALVSSLSKLCNGTSPSTVTMTAMANNMTS